eukprot:scaffold84956_cov70-Attheya_sp.AAC.2
MADETGKADGGDRTGAPTHTDNRGWISPLVPHMPWTGIRCPRSKATPPVPLDSIIVMDSPSPPPTAGGHSSPTWELVQVSTLGYEHKFPVDTKQDWRDESRVGKPTIVP